MKSLSVQSAVTFTRAKISLLITSAHSVKHQLQSSTK